MLKIYNQILAGQKKIPKSISLVVPVMNESSCIDTFIRESIAALDQFKKWEVIFVDDGSIDDSWDKISGYASTDNRVKGIRFTRNFGHQIAVMAGLARSTYELVAIIDADLQDPPSLIPRMSELIDDEVDIVYGRRSERIGETWFKRISARLFYRIFQRLVPFSIPLDTGDFRVVSKRAKDEIVSMYEQEPFLRGLFAFTGFRSVPYDYQRQPRFAGKSNYTFSKMLKLASNAVVSFSEVPYKVFAKFGLTLFGFAFLFGVSAIAYALLVESYAGWISIFALVLFFGSLNILFTALVGLYVIKSLHAARGRPTYFINRVLNLD